ncbi:MAG TPA: hypothetical protein PLS67_12925 [Accumulibacter sp.]|jgi:hypothetical protein|nr:hypothetical protein [Accumulibacter sp.]HQC81399.1 hypothetical protein [Accumulibacter sp.]
MVFRSLALSTLLLSSLTALAQAPAATEVSLKLNAADFAPTEGKSFDPKWAGPPRKAWTEGDKKTYTLTARLSAPAQEDFSFAFLVKENKTWDLDPVLSSVIVKFNKGETVGQSSFWLVCTRDGRIQGNLGREFDGYGNLYLAANALVTDPLLDTWKLSVSIPTTPHPVQCR